MPVYQWVGKNRLNKVQKGEMEASSEAAVRASLVRQKITPTRIKPKPKDLFANISFLQPKVKEKDIILFARQFSTMIDAGLPIIQCLDILHTQQDNVDLQKGAEAGQRVGGGRGHHGRGPQDIPQAFRRPVRQHDRRGRGRRHPGHDPETAGRLHGKGRPAQGQGQGRHDLPTGHPGHRVIVLAVILVFVIPVFEEMFADFGSELPAPTQFVVVLSDMVKSKILYIIAAVILFGFAFKKYYATEKGRDAIDALVLKLPVFGMLLRKVAVAKFTRTMGTMLASGVAILEALDIVAKTAGNRSVEKAIYNVRSGIAEGRTMADPLTESGVFPPMVCQMIAVGESTGALDAMLEKIADFYDEEVDQAVENMTALIEPIMLVFLGVTIGGLVVAMYLPIFKMAGAIN